MPNEVYYGVEPYSGKIICHYGVQGMAWGFAKGVANGLRKAVGVLDKNTGEYIYNQAKKIGNSYFGQRLKNDQLGSRTMANIGRAARGVAKGAYNTARGAAKGARDLAIGASRGVADFYDNVSGNKARREKELQNKKATEARIRYAEEQAKAKKIKDSAAARDSKIQDLKDLQYYRKYKDTNYSEKNDDNYKRGEKIHNNIKQQQARREKELRNKERQNITDFKRAERDDLQKQKNLQRRREQGRQARTNAKLKSGPYYYL